MHVLGIGKKGHYCLVVRRCLRVAPLFSPRNSPLGGTMYPYVTARLRVAACPARLFRVVFIPLFPPSSSRRRSRRPLRIGLFSFVFEKSA